MLLKSPKQQSECGSHVFFHSRMENWNKEQPGGNLWVISVTREQVILTSSWATCMRTWSKSVLKDGNDGTPPPNLPNSPAHPFTSDRLLPSQAAFCRQGGAWNGASGLDLVGKIAWYDPIALALHPCMVPIGIPASMRTRTQTVNHICIF